MRWITHLEGGPRRVNHAAVLINDKIYSFGGYCAGEDYTIFRPLDIHILDTETLRWSAVPLPQESEPQYYQAPYQRYGHTAVLYQNKAYLWGGRNDGEGSCNTLFEFDPEASTWSKLRTTGRIPPGRDGHSSCVIGDMMLVFGGFEEIFERFSNDVFALDFNTMIWTELHTCGEKPQWRDFHTSVAIGNRMYIYGGRSDLMVAYKNSMYVFGGYNGHTRQHFASLLRFDPANNLWGEVQVRGSGPEARRRQCCIVFNDKMFLFGGTSPSIDRAESISDTDQLIDHSDLFVMDFRPSLKTLAMISCLKFGLEEWFHELPHDIRLDFIALTKPNRISNPDRLEMPYG